MYILYNIEVAFLMDRMMIIVGTYIVQHASGYARLLASIRSGASCCLVIVALCE